jgi:sigma-B regulation protein RsbU (phosphoserine phosphatase)
VTLLPGDLLVMTSDGITEAMNFQGEPYGRERLTASIRRHQALAAQSLANQILWDVRRFVGLADQSDDITIVVIKAGG